MRWMENVNEVLQSMKPLYPHLFCGLFRFVPMIFVGIAVAAPCQAQSLSKLLDMAINSEPTFQSAKANLQISEARYRQAVGGLLPQVTVAVNTNANRRKYETMGIDASPEHDRYNSNSSQLSITQPLWRYANIVGMRQADAAILQAQQQLTGTEQEMFAKLVSGWCDLLAARDNIEFTKRQTTAMKRQWDIARRGVELGSFGAPQAYEVKAKYDQAVADNSMAQTELEIKFATLEQLVGALPYFDLPYLKDDVVLADVRIRKLEDWLTLVQSGNPNVRAAQHAFEAASEEISKQRAGHQPTLDLVATYGDNSQAVGGFPGQRGYDIGQRAIGLQLNIPLYSGGTQSAKVDEAIATREKARADIQAARRTAFLEAKQSWFGWQAAALRAQAGREVTEASKLAWKAARLGSDNGLKSELDVLQAEQQFYEGMRDLRKGHYEQITSYVRLKAVAGQLTKEDVASLDALFINSPSQPFSPKPEQIVPATKKATLPLKPSRDNE